MTPLLLMVGAWLVEDDFATAITMAGIETIRKMNYKSGGGSSHHQYLPGKPRNVGGLVKEL